MTADDAGWPDEAENVRRHFDHVVGKHKDEEPVPVEELTNTQLRAEIAFHASCREAHPQRISKSTLNSVYAYLTGQFVVMPNYLYRPKEDPSFPNLADCRRLVIGAAGGAEFLGESMSSSPDPRINRHLNKRELEAIVEAMRDTSDKRDWA